MINKESLFNPDDPHDVERLEDLVRNSSGGVTGAANVLSRKWPAGDASPSRETLYRWLRFAGDLGHQDGSTREAGRIRLTANGAKIARALRLLEEEKEARANIGAIKVAFHRTTASLTLAMAAFYPGDPDEADSLVVEPEVFPTGGDSLAALRGDKVDVAFAPIGLSEPSSVPTHGYAGLESSDEVRPICRVAIAAQRGLASEGLESLEELQSFFRKPGCKIYYPYATSFKNRLVNMLEGLGIDHNYFEMNRSRGLDSILEGIKVDSPQDAALKFIGHAQDSTPCLVVGWETWLFRVEGDVKKVNVDVHQLPAGIIPAVEFYLFVNTNSKRGRSIRPLLARLLRATVEVARMRDERGEDHQIEFIYKSKFFKKIIENQNFLNHFSYVENAVARGALLGEKQFVEFLVKKTGRVNAGERKYFENDIYIIDNINIENILEIWK